MTETASSFTVIDCAVSVVPHLELLKRAGVTSVMRYLNPLGPSQKQASEGEASAVASSGLSLGLVSEGWGDFAHGGVSAAAGERDGEHALVCAPRLGAPDGACVYFAVDTDASEAEVSKLVIPYFASIRALLSPKFRVGVYGSGLVCSRVLDAKLADLAWLACAMGWRESRSFLAGARWALAQKLPRSVGHFDFDPDDARGDFGAFRPFQASATPPAPPASPFEELLAQARELLARGEGAASALVHDATNGLHEAVEAALQAREGSL